jgi:hypothetical protein
MSDGGAVKTRSDCSTHSASMSRTGRSSAPNRLHPGSVLDHAELGQFLLSDGPIGRSGAHGPDANDRLCLRDPLRAGAVCREVQVNPANRWFRGLSISRTSPRLFGVLTRPMNVTGAFSARCSSVSSRPALAAGLVGGEGFAVDASLTPDRASRRSIEPPDRMATRPSERHRGFHLIRGTISLSPVQLGLGSRDFSRWLMNCIYLFP